MTEADRAMSDATAALQTAANPEKAAGMQAYMKTDMPFFGVQKPAREPIARQLARDYPPTSRVEYESLVLGLWSLPHREEKYLALEMARRHKRFVTVEALPLYRRLIVEGAWWDLVDEVATHMVRDLVVSSPEPAWSVVDRWIEDQDMWLRRSAIICQMGARERTDQRRLFSFCEATMGEREFFIRKAIGWALREYARTDPQAVARFVSANKGFLSGLSYREATKHIGALVT